MAMQVSEPANAIAGPVGGGDDAAIIAESLADPERFAVLYDRYAGQLYRYAGRRLGHADAEDMVAATFLAAFRARSRFDTARLDARPWLFGILTKELAKQHRKERARLRAIARACTETSDAGHAEAVADDVTAWAARQQLAKALAVLAPADRVVRPDLRRGRPGAGYPDRNCALPPEPGPPESPRRTRWQRPDERDGNAMNDLLQLEDFGRHLDRDLAEPTPALRRQVVASFRHEEARR